MLVSGRVGGGYRYFLMIQFKVGIFFQWGGGGQFAQAPTIHILNSLRASRAQWVLKAYVLKGIF